MEVFFETQDIVDFIYKQMDHHKDESTFLYKGDFEGVKLNLTFQSYNGSWFCKGEIGRRMIVVTKTSQFWFFFVSNVTRFTGHEFRDVAAFIQSEHTTQYAIQTGDFINFLQVLSSIITEGTCS